MAGLIDGLRALLQSRQAEEKKTDWEAYTSVLRAIADGEQLDPSEVALSLESVGKSVDDLESDLEKFRKRLEWRQELDRLPQLQRDLAAAVKAHDAAKSEYDRIVPVLAAKVEGAYVAKSAIENAINASRLAEGFLRSQPLNTALVEQERRLNERQAALMDGRRELVGRIGEQLAFAADSAAAAKRQPEHEAYHQEREQAYRGRAAAFDPHLAKVETELATIRGELEAIRLAKLQP